MKSSSLFDLIRSLSKHEKGYFRKFSRIYSTEGDKNYIELFDFIEKMDVYDEKMIKSEFRRSKWIGHLPVLKKYLFAQILKSLELYQRAGKKDEKSIFKQVDILTSRGLYKEAADMLRDGQEVAIRNENYYSLLSSYERERLLVGFIQTSSQKAKEIEVVWRKQQETMTVISAIMEIKRISDHLRNNYSKYGVIRDEVLMVEIDEFAEKELMPVFDLYPSVTYRHVAYSAAILYYTLKGDNDSILRYTREHLNLVLDNPRYFASRHLHVLSIYCNYLHCCLECGLFKEFDAHIKTFEGLTTNNGLAGGAYKFKLLFRLYFGYIAVRKAYPLVFHYMRKFEKDFKLYSPILDAGERAYLASKVAYLLFLNGRKSEALDWINICLDMEKDDLNEITKINIRVLDMILHYELGNFSLLESKLLSAKRYLGRNRIYFKSEQVIIAHLKQLVRVETKEAELALVRKFHAALREVYDRYPTERLLIEELSLFHWLETKMKTYKKK